MNYELALQLKNAGFPGSEKWEDCKVLFRNSENMNDDREVVSLSELIEACENKFDSLYLSSGRWYTGSCTGSTPEEAVANLWLSLQKK